MNYPKGTVKTQTKNINYGNRGMGLESDINDTNQYYLNLDIAVIHKKPTPIVISKVDYHSRKDAVIKEAHFRIPSTTDYNGIYRGKYIDFEAKETMLKQFFPLRNIHSHQIEHLKKIIAHGGIGFLIVRFSTLGETYYLDGTKLFTFLEQNTRQSIPIEYFRKEGYQIKEKFQPRIDYLKIIDHIYFGGNKNEMEKNS